MRIRFVLACAMMASLAAAASAQERRPAPAAQAAPAQAVPPAPPQPAQTPAPNPAKPAAAPTLPSQTSATYGDWVHRCVRVGADLAQQACEIFQQVQANQGGQAVTVMTLAVGRPGPQATILITAALPVNLSFSAPVALAMEGAAKGARVEFRNAAEAPVAIPVSLNGFAQALDALQPRR